MAISPFPTPRPGSPESERRRARLVALLVVLGIAASLLAYGISPSVRHAVTHAAHSVGHVLDKDAKSHKAKVTPKRVRLYSHPPTRRSHPSTGAPKGASRTSTTG